MKKVVFPVAAAVLCVAVAMAVAGPVHAQNGNTWHIEYFPNPDWSGFPVLTQDVPILNLNWSGGSPGSGVPAENFTARMTSPVSFPAGVYRFSLLADDEAALGVDGSAVLDTIGQNQPGQAVTVDVAMTAGVHQLEVDYRQFTQAAFVSLSWTLLPPLTTTGPILLPETGSSGTGSATGVVSQFGDYTRCMQQGLHQASCFVSNAENSPNLGSIQMEPQITIWGNCTADTTMTLLTGPDNTPVEYRCSKTEAGWFPG